MFCVRRGAEGGNPTFFGFYSPDLQGFTGVGHSIEDCLYQARWGMQEHVAALKEQGLLGSWKLSVCVTGVTPARRAPAIHTESIVRVLRMLSSGLALNELIEAHGRRPCKK